MPRITRVEYDGRAGHFKISWRCNNRACKRVRRGVWIEMANAYPDGYEVPAHACGYCGARGAIAVGVQYAVNGRAVESLEAV